MSFQNSGCADVGVSELELHTLRLKILRAFDHNEVLWETSPLCCSHNLAHGAAASVASATADP